MNKKGFTLIELLAVIVILAIIALIAVPIVLNIINNSKESSKLRSSEMYIKAVENSIATSNINNEKLEDGMYDILENGNICLEYTGNECINKLSVKVKGETPRSGFITLENNKILAFELMYIDKIIIKESTGEVKSIENIYISVKDDNPGIICGETNVEDYNQTNCYIKSIEDLAALSTLVNSGKTFEGKTIELSSSLDFNNKASYASKKVNRTLITGEGFTPIGKNGRNFMGTFDGNDNTIRGLYINKPESGGLGLFGYINSSTIQNLNIDKANVTGTSSVGILVGINNLGTIQNINISNTNLIGSDRIVGSLVANNQSGTIIGIQANNVNVVGSYLNTGGLIGLNKSSTVEDVTLNNINVTNKNKGAGGMIGSNESGGAVKNIKASNITINVHHYSGGVIGSNSGIVQDVELKNIEMTGTGEYLGSLIGSNTGELVENIRLQNVKITNSTNSGGIIGNNAAGTIKNVIGNNIKISGKQRGAGALVGSNGTGLITQIKLKDVYVEANDYVGGLVGSNSGIIKDVILKGNVKGGIDAGLIVGRNVTGIVNTVVVEGNIEGIHHNIGGIVGRVGGTADVADNISGVFLSGSVIGASYTDRGIGNYGTYLPNINILASADITVNGSIVESTDISSKAGKTLTDMGKASQSEYEAIGFDFDEETESEVYWYFNENDELDFIIKELK